MPIECHLMVQQVASELDFFRGKPGFLQISKAWWA